MNIKKLFGELLSATLACILLCMPALAASPGNGADKPAQGRLWLDLEAWDAEQNVSVTLVDYRFGSYDVEETETEIPALNYVPLGVTFSAGPSFRLFAYSDLDGDGKYEMQWNNSMEVIPFDQVPVPGSKTNDFWWGQGENLLWSSIGDIHVFQESILNADGWRTLTTDYLVDLYGPDTIVLFECGRPGFSSYWWFYLTGEDGAAGPGSGAGRSTVTVTGQGYLTSPWAKTVVDEASGNGLIPALVENNHDLYFQGEVTRAEFAAIAVKLYEAMSRKEAVHTDSNPFTDVQAGTDEYQYIMAAYELGIVKGVTDATFQPGALVSRQDAALMLSRVYEKLGGTIPAGVGTAFSDDAAIAPYAKDAVAFMSAKGIVNGMGDGRFAPAGSATVEQALKIALEMLGSLKV